MTRSTRKFLLIAASAVAMVALAVAPAEAKHIPTTPVVGPPVCGIFPPQFTVGTSTAAPVSPTRWGIFGRCWHTGAPMTAMIDDPATVQNPDVTFDLGYSDQTGSFNTANIGLSVLARSGDTVTVTDGNGLTRMHVIPGLTVTTVDAANDTVSGTAAPGSRITVLAAFHWPKDAANATEQATRVVVADAAGLWTADFTTVSDPDDQGTHDIRTGSGIAAQQINPDPPVGWPGPDPFPITLWSFTNQTWILQQLQPVTTQDCKGGGWRYVVDQAQNHFVNQGDCASYVSTHGNNPANGGPYSP